MKIAWLLWLWAIRMCSTSEWWTNCERGYVFSDNRVECHNNYFSILDPNQYPLNIKILTYLDLSSNGLTTLGDNVFRNVSKLKTLILSNNRLGILQHRSFLSLYELETLDLRNNRLTSLTDKRLFIFQGQLRQLELSHNKITFISAEVLVPLRSLEILKLSDNRFFCDCKLRFTMKWCDLRELYTNATCTTPFLYSGLPWTVLKPTESCEDLDILDAISKSEEKTVTEKKDNRIEVDLLIVGVSLSLVLIWCSVIGLYLWQRLANRCRKEKENDIYDEAKPNYYYYYECAKSHTEK
jgi:hypothetical protein